MQRIAENGFSVPLLLEEITGSQIAAFGWLNVVISAAVLFLFVFAERIKKWSAKLWLHVVGTLIVERIAQMDVVLVSTRSGRGTPEENPA